MKKRWSIPLSTMLRAPNYSHCRDTDWAWVSYCLSLVQISEYVLLFSKGVVWIDWKGKDASLPFTEMKLRPSYFSQTIPTTQG